MATVIISSGITSSGLAVTDGNGLEVFGTAKNTSVFSGGSATVFFGGEMLVTQVNEAGFLDVCGGVANSNTILGGGRILVSAGGSANVNSIQSGGTMTVGTAGRASLVANSGGLLTVSSGGTAYIANAASGGLVEILAGASGVFLTLAETGRLVISSGGIAEKVNLNGIATVYAAGSASGVTVSDGGRFLVSGGFAQGVNILAGGNAVLSGGSANNAEVASDGFLTVSSGGTASGVEVNGWATVMSGGMVDSVEVNPDGWLVVSAGGKLTGQMTFAAGTTVNVYANAVFDFDISELAPGPDARINDLSLVHGSPAFTLTVSGFQTHGDYSLAAGAAGFSITVSVVNAGGEKLGTLEVGQTVNIKGTDYTLNLGADEVLSVSVGAAVLADAKSDINGNCISDVMFQLVGGDYAFGQIGFWLDGTNEWQSQMSVHPMDSWKVLGAYDMDASGKADTVLVGNIVLPVGDIDLPMYAVGYYTDSVDSDANWQNISYLGNPGLNVWENEVGNLTGNRGMNSIVWHSTDLGVLGVWTDGTDNWIGLGIGYKDDWKMVGCGDFDGDGRDSVLMSFLGAAYYTVDIDETGTEGVVNPLTTSDANWTVAAIGDFSGDGKDDIIAYNASASLVAMWSDGDAVNNWSLLGMLDNSDWFIVGAGDYDGNQQDDLLVRQKSTGMLGYYTCGDLDQWNVLGYGVSMDWAVIA